MDKKTLWVGLGALLLVLLATLGTVWFARADSFRGTAYGEPYPAAPPIQLTRADGRVFQLSDQRGKIVLLFFGYTSCPDVCPTTLADLQQVVDKLGSAASSVQVVFVSVDPQRDTPEAIQKYVEHFDKNFIGLSGAEQELQPIWDAYGIYRSVSSAHVGMDYSVDHTARITLIDADGNLRLAYPSDVPVEDILHDVQLLLK